jgi:hypothetical protein
LVQVAAVLMATLVSVDGSVAGELLSVDGSDVKWASPSQGRMTVVTYTVLSRRLSLPDHSSTLSPDNCGTMDPFPDIVSGSIGVTDSTAKDELHSAFAAWEKVAGVRFVEVGGDERANIVVGATVNSIGRAFANLSLADRAGLQPAARALGASTNKNTAKSQDSSQTTKVAAIEQAYVCLNPKFRWKVGFDGDLGVYDLRHTFIHEIGHAIGLDHPGSSGAVMGYRYDERVHDLQASDIHAAQRLYGGPRVAE